MGKRNPLEPVVLAMVPVGRRKPYTPMPEPTSARQSRGSLSGQRFAAMRLVVRTKANTLEFVPSVRFRADNDAEVEMSLWAVPGGGRMTTQEIRTICVRNGWILLEPDLDKRRSATPRRYVWPQYR